ncbi:MAG: glycoside hydrolase family 3 protein [Faecousia sp.]
MKYALLFLCLLLLTGCAASSPEETATEPIHTTAPTEAQVTQATTVPTEPPDPIQEMLEQMSLEERVGQLFLARCNNTTALEDIRQYHLGGFVLFGRDFDGQTPDTLRQTLASYQAASRLPLLIAVDEEGGTVTRVSRYPAFREEPLPSPRDSYAWKGLEGCLVVEEAKCQLLSGLDINVNLGPVCDISTHPQAFLYRRSLGQDPETTAQYVTQTVELMDTYRIGSVLKHFPGYGNNADTHTGIAVDSRSLEELESNDLIPFAAGIQAGCGAVMVSHMIVEALDETMPASLSPAVHRYLRETMGFDGVILTDDLVMEAITEQYGAGEAAVLAVLAGNDLLCATDYAVQYEAVLQAVLDGRIDMVTLDNAVRHVLEWKMQLGLLEA